MFPALFQTRSCDALNMTEQESQWNLQMFTPIMKQETVHLDEEEIPQYTDDEETLCKDYMSPCKPLQTLDCVNNSDYQFYVLEEVKKEFPEEHSPQPLSSISCRLAFKNEELSQVIERQEFKQENSEEGFSLIKNEEIEDEEYPLIVKIESLKEHRVLDNFKDTTVHYDVLVTPQQVQCKFCSRTFKNRYSLLVHNNEHIKVVMYPTPVDVEINELQKCKFCDEYFNSHTNMLAHICDVHGNDRHKSESYNESIKPYVNRKNGEKIEYKCDLCKRLYKSKEALVVHTKRIHIDYGKMFECHCGKKFHSPQRLSQHKRRQHNPKVKIINNEKLQCDSCNNFFKTKHLLIGHIKNVHYDYGKIFECSCGEQFHTPINLYLHKKKQHGLDDKIMNKEQSSCDSCHKFFRTQKHLARHIMRIHYDYGKTFECSCGKQFRTPIHLYQHSQRMHCADSKNINNEGFQCHICQKLLKTKRYLTAHIKSAHYDYGKTFECWCGKQFRTPRRLWIHECRIHSTNSENKFQCDYCGKFFQNKRNLVRHIKYAHYDYGKMFSCWCGKQFSKPRLLRRHEKRQHNTNIAALKPQFQCDICQKFFKTKENITDHIKNVHYDYGKVFVCVCGKQFRTPLRLKVHERNVHNNKARI